MASLIPVLSQVRTFTTEHGRALLVGLAVSGWALALYSCSTNRTQQKQIELATQAYKYPRIERHEERQEHHEADESLNVEGEGTLRELPDGTRELNFKGHLTSSTTSQTDVTTSSSTASTPVLPPNYAAVRPPARMLWAGYGLLDRTPIAGTALRLVGPLWVGGFVRPGAVWDAGPTLAVWW